MRHRCYFIYSMYLYPSYHFDEVIVQLNWLLQTGIALSWLFRSVLFPMDITQMCCIKQFGIMFIHKSIQCACFCGIFTFSALHVDVIQNKMQESIM